MGQAALGQALQENIAPLLWKASVLGMMHLSLLLLGISMAAGSLRGGLHTGIATPPPTETSTVATPMTTLLPATPASTSASATTMQLPGTSASSSALAKLTATQLVEDPWRLPVVENATYLATSGICISDLRHPQSGCDRYTKTMDCVLNGCVWQFPATTTTTTTF